MDAVRDRAARPMKLYAGTSGYSYKEWVGTFYPPKTPANRMLHFYGERFGTVEINNTFYRMPQGPIVARWAGEVPDGFRFVLKAPKRITHDRRLRDVEEETRHFVEVAASLGGKQGPLLFQLPPNFKKDVDALRSFLALLGPTPAAFEFRHESWNEDAVHEALRAHGKALCLADTEEREAPLVSTAGWGYLRLRRSDYGDAELSAWLDRIRREPWEEAFVFFKHEDEGKGPAMAARFLELAGSPQTIV
jgi:uncharacterized protein YecE (DUF72 family)